MKKRGQVTFELTNLMEKLIGSSEGLFLSLFSSSLITLSLSLFTNYPLLPLLPLSSSPFCPRSVAATQELPEDKDIFHIGASIYAEKPKKDIYDFVGTFSSNSTREGLEEVVVGEGRGRTEPLTVDNMLWGETVVASGTCIGVVVYTGSETRFCGVGGGGEIWFLMTHCFLF